MTNYGVEEQKLPRAEHAPESLTHPVGELELPEGIQRMGCHTPKEGVGYVWPRQGAEDACALAVS